MDLSATIDYNPSGYSIPVGQKLNVTVTVSNASGSDIELNEIIPEIKMTNLTFPTDAVSAAIGKCRLDADNVVPAGGDAKFIFSIEFHSSSKGSTYDIGCVIYGNNDEVVAPTPATVTVI